MFSLYIDDGCSDFGFNICNPTDPTTGAYPLRSKSRRILLSIPGGGFMFFK